MSAKEIFLWWRALGPDKEIGDPEIYADMGSRALDFGEPLLALDICRRGLAIAVTHNPCTLRLRQLEALALARSGATSAARRAMEHLAEGGGDGTGGDSESVGIHARILKDLWIRARGTPGAEDLLQQALSRYQQAYVVGARPWIGVNVATLLLAAGRRPEAQRAAANVLANMADAPSEDDAWILLTTAECQLILDNPLRAAELYGSAVAQRVPLGRLTSARRNARIILDAMGQGEPELEAIFPRSRAVVFAGHRSDSPGRARPRFPPESQDAAAAIMRRLLESRQAKIGIASAADGADIIFLEAMLAVGGEIHIVLLAPPSAFQEMSVADHGGWRSRFEAVLAKATTVTVLAREANEPVDFVYANSMLLGLARLKSAQYGCHLEGLAIWDGEPGLAGGTGSAVRAWILHGLPISSLDPIEGKVRPVTAANVPESPSTGDHRIATLLFADAQGFSRLSSRDVSVFTDQVLAPLGARLDEYGGGVLCRNTWGDAIYVAFDKAVDGARFANDIVESCAPQRILEMGLPDFVEFRVSLHAGPVRQIFDPISKNPNLIGPHVSWAARIEPITPAGIVYSSEAFAALCALDPDAGDIECSYVGEVPLAKGYGTLPTYRVARFRRLPGMSFD